MTFTVRILDDSITEGDEFFALRANSPEISTAPVCLQNFNLGSDNGAVVESYAKLWFKA